MRTTIRSEYEKGVDYYPLLQAARMIESELKADAQFKSADQVKPKAHRKAKAKGYASLFSVDKDLTHLERHGVKQPMK